MYITLFEERDKLNYKDGSKHKKTKNEFMCNIYIKNNNFINNNNNIIGGMCHSTKEKEN